MIKVGDYLYNSLDENKYLYALFKKIAKEYTCLLLKSDYVITITNKEKLDALRFADLLSKCTIEAKKDRCFNLAQNLVTMLNKIFPDDVAVDYCLGSVLSNVNNYFGLQNNCSTYYNHDIVEFIDEFITKESFRIPNEQESYFINKQRIAYQNLKQSESYSFSAPTSLGKTFVIRMFIKESILSGEKANFVIVVPTNALINELYNRVIDDLQGTLWENGYKVVKSPASILQEEDEYNYIMVYTQERLLYHLIQAKNVPVNYLFVDEAHKISKGEGRSVFFYKIMNIINKEHSGARVYFSSPNIPNPQVYLELVNENLSKLSTRIKYSPVNQSKIIINQDTNKSSYYLEIDSQFYDIDDIESEVFKDKNIVQIVKTFGHNKSNIVFCDTKKNAVFWANEYSKDEPDIDNEELTLLIQEIKEDIHGDCFLAATLKKGVAYHIAYIPARIKEKIEILFKKNIIKTVFCTSTLLEGVNFPAENLFLMLDSRSIWLKDEYRVDFKNLIGRVGRIEYNMYGNIFFVAKAGTSEQFKRAVNCEVQEQQLSVDYYLSESRKKDIVNVLSSGSTIIEKKDTYEEYNFARYVLNILLKDILNNQKGKFHKLFEKYLTEDVLSKIKVNFATNPCVQDDITTTADQIATIDQELQVSQISYPDKINYNNVKQFLIKLHGLFNWEKYESKSDIGNVVRLSYYAVLLNQWMVGLGINQIINATIDYHKDTGKIFIDGKNIDYLDSVEQRNIVINEVLDTLERIIQFKIKNYFLKFSERKTINEQEMSGGDWYEFVEYGACSKAVVLLQKIGFSRESAIYINRAHSDKFKIKDGRLVLLKNSLLRCPKIANETTQILYNHRELFGDN